ncbi:MAG TPA: hypothetical protein VIL52_00585 [Bacteroidota bacterium]
MTDQERLKDFVEKVLTYFNNDFAELKRQNVTASFPYIFHAFAGIDFLGGLACGFKDKDGKRNSGDRSRWFISTWMSKADARYNKSHSGRNVADYLYTFLRSGLFHAACVEGSIKVQTSEDLKSHHLGYSFDDGKSIMFIHPIQFAEHFHRAADLFLEDLYKDNNKVTTAVVHSQKYKEDTTTKEKMYNLEYLFQELTSNSPLVAGTRATSSAQKIS